MRQVCSIGIILLTLLLSPTLLAVGKKNTGKAPKAKLLLTSTPLPREFHGFTCGSSVMATMALCQEKGWVFWAKKPDQRSQLRNGRRFKLENANVVPPKGEDVARYRLTFLRGRLIGIRALFQLADPKRFTQLSQSFGKPVRSHKSQAEWVDENLNRSWKIWKNGKEVEITDLRLLRRMRFLLGSEIKKRLFKNTAKPKAASEPVKKK